MDLWSVHVTNNVTRTPFLLRHSWNSGKPRPSWLGGGGGLDDCGGGGGGGRVFDARDLSFNLKPPRFVVRATGKKNNNPGNSSSSSSGNDDHLVPEGYGANGNNSENIKDTSSEKSYHINSDWREVRAQFIRGEQAETDLQYQSKPLGEKWAHPIAVPETGCILVATEKLDGVRTFERTVVLLLRSGNRHPEEGPFGVVINRPLQKKIKHMRPTNIDLATTFSDCFLHFGGPLEASMFLLKTGGKGKLPGFEEVMPGLCFGARNSLDEAAGLVKKGVLNPQDFRFFVGYAGWQLDQLAEEIESNYWHVAACSPSLIYGASSENLWEEILQLMGGQYSELSRKPKQDM
ncbi:uncharacterized protein LOC126796056 [Argentina anserina]|uniref:uncharacterized protein LOC126796056 n=1 Tax=Argentina anserina TaxID=57926 RepID=UPI0021763723|nr:uncharacterized protein LOC126796056 [Potentilla anserina]